MCIRDSRLKRCLYITGRHGLLRCKLFRQVLCVGINLPVYGLLILRQHLITVSYTHLQGDGTQEPEQPGSSLSDYINPDPQEPLRYPSGNTAGSAGNTTTAATPEPRADALTDLSSYYEDCRKQLTGLGSGDQHFDNVVPKSLWSTIEQSYHTGAYEQGYVVDAVSYTHLLVRSLPVIRQSVKSNP